MNPNRRITRSSTNRMLGGVCAGLANYLGVDPTLVRIGFVLLTLWGVSPLLYVILWVVLPSDTSATGSWQGQVQQAIGEMQERATTLTTEVTSQVQRFTGNTATTTPPATGGAAQSQPPMESGEQGPSTGPTTRL